MLSLCTGDTRCLGAEHGDDLHTLESYLTSWVSKFNNAVYTTESLEDMNTYLPCLPQLASWLLHLCHLPQFSEGSWNGPQLRVMQIWRIKWNIQILIPRKKKNSDQYSVRYSFLPLTWHQKRTNTKTLTSFSIHDGCAGSDYTTAVKLSFICTFVIIVKPWQVQLQPSNEDSLLSTLSSK